MAIFIPIHLTPERAPVPPSAQTRTNCQLVEAQVQVPSELMPRPLLTARLRRLWPSRPFSRSCPRQEASHKVVQLVAPRRSSRNPFKTRWTRTLFDGKRPPLSMSLLKTRTLRYDEGSMVY